MSNHEYFEELCAGAVAAIARSGQLAESEWRELMEHLPGCPECQALIAEFAEVSFRLVQLPAVAGDGVRIPTSKSRPTLQFPRSRILSESRAQPLTAFRRNRTIGRMGIAIALTASMAFCFVAGLRVAGRTRAILPSPSPVVAAAHNEPAEIGAAHGPLVEDKKGLAAQLRLSEQRAATALNTSREVEAELRSRIAELDQTNAELTRRESESDSQLAQLQSEVRNLRAENGASRNAAAAAQAELVERGFEIKRVNTQLEDEKQRNATLKEAQDLITSPDTHVWEFQDNDENGKRVPFGKIVYQEGRKLIFYAYNLPENDSKKTQAAFYVWGEKPGTHQPIMNLGVLRGSNDEPRHWELKFNNPNVLTGISSLFVTAEPGIPEKPRGKRMLFASLDPKAERQ